MTDTAPAAPTFKKRTNKSTNIRKRPATPPPTAAQDSDSSGSELTDDESGVRVKRRKREGLQTSSAINRPGDRDRDLSKSTRFAADRNTAISENQDATRSSTWYTDSALKGSAAAARAVSKDGVDAQDGNYKGTSTYGSFIQKHPDRQAKTVGPVKAPTNVRAITVTDFAPDVCKDYKQTGFCGFGDSCKFLHAREDYKQGWQLDKEWEKAGRNGSKANGGKPEDADLDDEEKMLRDIPFKCIICKGDYKMPMMTKCGHYFCEKCCMTRYMKEKKKGCAQCGADTHGSFGVAKKLKALLEKKKVREEEREAKEAEES